MQATKTKSSFNTLINWMALIAVIANVIVILLPQPKWASSGSLTIPVEVTVFDALSAKPIKEALVAIIKAPPATGGFELTEYQDNFSWGFSAIQEIGTPTNAYGLAAINQEFSTGASYKRPTPFANTAGYWVLVSADGYAKVAIPLRYELMETEKLKFLGRLTAYVGLTSSPAN